MRTPTMSVPLSRIRRGRSTHIDIRRPLARLQERGPAARCAASGQLAAQPAAPANEWQIVVIRSSTSPEPGVGLSTCTSLGRVGEVMFHATSRCYSPAWGRALLDSLLDNGGVFWRMWTDSGGLVRDRLHDHGRPRKVLECLTRKRSLVHIQYRPPSMTRP